MNSKSALIVTAAFFWPGIGYAEVTLDGSLGTMFVNPGDSVPAGNGFTYDIKAEHGRQAGPNLFHSFDKFNVGLGEQANFSGPANISNVVSRVTGGESSIAGSVTASISGASLWLVNPAGFILTNGAIVDVDGTFHLSTADFLAFSDGARFFSNLSATSTLSTTAITSFGFLTDSRGTIAIDSGRSLTGNEGIGEDESTGHNLHINADFISIQNADLHAKEIGVRMGDATFGEIKIGSSLLETVSGGIFFEGGNIYAVDSLITASGQDSAVEVRANSLTLDGINGTSAIRSGELGASGGDIDIEANNISLLKNAELSTSSGGGREGGDIRLDAKTILISDNSELALFAGTGSQAGDIIINTTDILINNNSSLNSSSKFQGATAGSIEITATGRFGIESGSSLLAESDNAGIGGSVSVSAANIVITDQATIDVQSFGSGDADLVELRALSGITISASAKINASSSGAGNGGTVQLSAPDITLNDVDILGEAIGLGNGGDILINADTVSISNGSNVNVSSITTLADGGDAGVVSIDAATVNITDTEFLLATRGGGIGGVLKIVATDIDLSQTLIVAEADGRGAGGEIIMRGDTIDWLDVAVNASATGAGLGGEIRLQGGAITLTNPDINISAKGSGAAGDLIATGDSFVATGTDGIFGDSQGTGTGADIQLLTTQTSLSDITITTSSLGNGQAGEIQIFSADSVTINNAILDSQTRLAGIGGDIDIQTKDLSLLGAGSANVAAFGSGNAGHIEIAAENVSISGEGALVLTASGSGKGGKLSLNADNVTLSENAEIIGSVSGDAFGDLLQFNTTSFVLQDSAEIASNTMGSGAGGTIDINTTEFLIQDRAGITAETLSPGRGDAGLIKVDASNFVMAGGVIITNTKSAGVGGIVDVLADTIRIENNGAIKSDSLSVGDGGDIILTARNSFLLSNASIEAVTRNSGVGGLIQIQAPEIDLGEAGVINISALSGTGDAGELTITGTRLTLDNNTIATGTFTDGNAGTVILIADTITAIDADIKGETFGNGEGADIEFMAADIALTGTIINSSTEGAGEGGIIRFSGDNIVIDNRSAIESDSLGSGAGGAIILMASDSFNLSNAGIEAETKGSGVGGLIEIRAPDITLGEDAVINISALSGSGDAGELTITGTRLTLDSSTIATATFTDGNAGIVTLTADTITATQASIQGETFGNGEGADIELFAPDMVLARTRINSSTEGPGEGGIIRLTGDTVLIEGSTIIAETEGTGPGGDLIIATKTILLDQSTLSASANGHGNAGRIEIETTGGTFQNNTIISSDTTGNGVGGDILITANTLDIFSDATISSSATGLSNAGDVTLLVPDTLQIVGGAIQTTSAQSGGGSIVIETEKRIRIDQSIVSASANGVTADSSGGNVSIDPELFTLRQSQIVAQANAGSGGNITLVATNFVADTETLISASSQRGIDGTVEIESPNQAANPISAELNTGFQVLPMFLSNNCSSSGLQDRSYLIVDNMNPVRRDPADYLAAPTQTPMQDASAIAYTKIKAGAVSLATSPGC